DELSGDFTMSPGDGPVLFLDAGGSSREVTLPDADEMENRLLLIFNTSDGGETLTIKDSNGTVLTISQGEGGLLFSNGASWIGFGATSIAFSQGEAVTLTSDTLGDVAGDSSVAATVGDVNGVIAELNKVITDVAAIHASLRGGDILA